MASKPKASTLDSYLEANPARTTGKCWACSLPEIGEIERARAENRGNVFAYVRWLVNERGYDGRIASAARLTYHFREKHNETRNRPR